LDINAAVSRPPIGSVAGALSAGNLARRIEHALDVMVQGSLKADASNRATAFGNQVQAFHRRLPFRSAVLALGKRHDVVAGVAEGVQRAAVGQRDRIFEFPGPAAVAQLAGPSRNAQRRPSGICSLGGAGLPSGLVMQFPGRE
jgi:hypothetical protein